MKQETTKTFSFTKGDETFEIEVSKITTYDHSSPYPYKDRVYFEISNLPNWLNEDEIWETLFTAGFVNTRDLVNGKI